MAGSIDLALTEGTVQAAQQGVEPGFLLAGGAEFGTGREAIGGGREPVCSGILLVNLVFALDHIHCLLIPWLAHFSDYAALKKWNQ